MVLVFDKTERWPKFLKESTKPSWNSSLEIHGAGGGGGGGIFWGHT